MKKTIAFLLSLVMVFTSLSILTLGVTADEPEAPLPGTTAYEDALKAAGYVGVDSFGSMEDFSETGKYYLTQDFVLPDSESNHGYLRGVEFKGILDGNGHTVYNAKFALFNNLKGTIKNLVFSKYTNQEETEAFVTKQSLLNGISDGALLENVTSNRKFDENISDYWGTIVRDVPANATVTFRNVTNNSSIAFPYTAYNIKIGGFIGLARTNSTIIFENCVNNGNVKGSQAGGFIAVLLGGNTVSFENCANNGTVIGSIGSNGTLDGAYGIAGGFIGSYNNAYKRDTSLNISFENCVNTGDVIRWEGAYQPTKKDHKVAQGGFIGNLGEGSNQYPLTLSVKNCTVSDCQIGAGTSWSDKIDESTGVVAIDYTQGYVGAIAGWFGTGNNSGQDSVTIENVIVRNVTIESADPAFASLFLNTNNDAVKTVNLKECFAISCDEIRAATGNVKFTHTASSEAVTVNKTQKSAVADDKMALRFLGTIDSLNYQGIGFVVEEKIEDNKSYYFLYNKKAYNEVINGTGKLTKVDLGGNYITAAVLENVSATNTKKVTYTVTPYAINLENSAIVGTAKSISLTAGNLS